MGFTKYFIALSVITIALTACSTQKTLDHQNSCNVACWSQDANGNMTNNGRFMRVLGETYNHLCYPAGYEPPQDISKDKKLSEACGENFPDCSHGKCWISGDAHN